MKLGFLITLLWVTVATAQVVTPFTVVASRTKVFLVGDSMTSNTGQPCWFVPFTNATKVNFGLFAGIVNAAHNGDYLDSSGGIMDEYPTEVQPFIDLTKTNLLILFIGANNGMPNFGDCNDFIADMNTYVNRAVADKMVVAVWTTAVNWRITNSLTYFTNWCAITNAVMTNANITFRYNDAGVYGTNVITTGTVFGDVPPLHYDDNAQETNAFNLAGVLTNTTPFPATNVTVFSAGKAFWGQ